MLTFSDTLLTPRDALVILITLLHRPCGRATKMSPPAARNLSRIAAKTSQNLSELPTRTASQHAERMLLPGVYEASRRITVLSRGGEISLSVF